MICFPSDFLLKIKYFCWHFSLATCSWVKLYIKGWRSKLLLTFTCVWITLVLCNFWGKIRQFHSFLLAAKAESNIVIELGNKTNIFNMYFILNSILNIDEALAASLMAPSPPPNLASKEGRRAYGCLCVILPTTPGCGWMTSSVYHPPSYQDAWRTM